MFVSVPHTRAKKEVLIVFPELDKTNELSPAVSDVCLKYTRMIPTITLFLHLTSLMD